MAKAVFRPMEITMSGEKVQLKSPTEFPELAHLAPAEEELEEIEDAAEEYAGPTADDLRREAENFKVQWESEREAMIRSARAEADGIIKEAEEAAFREVKRKTDEAQSLKREAQDEGERIIAAAHEKARQIENDSRSAFEAERKDAEERGRAAGRDAGFEEGKAEVERLIQRSQIVLERAQDKRAEILAETEQEIIDLVLLISRKVIKIISENQRNVILQNVVQALRKVKGRGNIIIRVNMADVKLSTEHMKDFIKLVEGSKSIQVVEDSSVDQGGCIIETDFGEIDARISSQLSELETKILEISPIRAKAKTRVLGEEAQA
ncbi:MAG: flagellar assembly protein FliH [Treponema sp.]|jgi:flagellar assembly protein FliH|nr:flagellar assembly protein FliH [Treponema sp.]